MSFPRYPKYKDSGVKWLGEVPVHWGVSKMKWVAKMESGHTPDKKVQEYWENGNIPWVSLNDTAYLKEHDYISDTAYQITELGIANSSAHLLPARAVVFSRDATIGRCAITTRPMAVSQHFIAWICGDAMTPEYLLMVLRSMAQELDSLTTGATLKTIGMPEVRTLVTPVPPLDDQVAITAFLTRETAKIDALVAEQQRLIELLKEKRQAVISNVVTKGLNPNVSMKPSGIEWLGDVPTHWEMKRLKHISPFITVGIVVNPSTFVADDGPPFIYGGDIREGVIDWENARRIDVASTEANAKTMLKAGDLLTVRVGAPGVTAVVPKECEGGNCASVMLIRGGAYNSGWLCFAMNTRIVRFQVEVVQYGAAQEQFNISHAVNFWVPTPPRNEQDDIARFLVSATAELDALTAEAQRAIDLLQERRAALISAAVTGQIDVRGMSDKVAA